MAGVWSGCHWVDGGWPARRRAPWGSQTLPCHCRVPVAFWSLDRLTGPSGERQTSQMDMGK